jgi:hypothetical protein
LPNFGTKNIPTSGNISFSNFNGTRKRIAVSYTITGNITGGLSLFPFATSPARTPAATRYQANLPGWDFTWTINPGVTVTAPRTGTALLTGANGPAGWHPDVTITIVNQGTIAGASGGGRAGGFGFGTQPAALAGQPGLSGGTAINAQRPITIQNVTSPTFAAGIYGGAGGGGGGGGVGSAPFTSPLPPKFGGPVTVPGERVGGGGGGGGRLRSPIAAPGGAGGTAPTLNPQFDAAGTNGQAGSLPNHGLGGAGGSRPPSGSIGGTGGRGGQLAAVGVAGQAGTAPSPASTPGTGGAGGARGNYIVGNPLVTWQATGTVAGGVG